MAIIPRDYDSDSLSKLLILGVDSQKNTKLKTLVYNNLVSGDYEYKESGSLIREILYNAAKVYVISSETDVFMEIQFQSH